VAINASTSAETAVMERLETLVAELVISKRLHLDMVAEPAGGIFGLWADLKRRRNARKLGNELFPEIQKAFREGVQAHYLLTLQFEQGIVEERNHLQLALARSRAEDLIIREKARQIIARRVAMVHQLFVIRRILIQAGVPEETVERKIGQHVERLIDTLGTELTTGGNNEHDER
jgi:hypothetical protein